MKKLYFIDSENVGDNWIALLSSVSPDDELLVFYTKKSPHMSYDSVIAIKETDKSIQFIECFCGNNGLDFQLSTELGSRIHTIGDDAFIIVSNDCGFDAVIKYWEKRGVNISRIKGNECRFSAEKSGVIEHASVNAAPAPSEKPLQSAEGTVPSEKPAQAAESSTPSEKTTQTAEGGTAPSPVDDNAKEILYIIGKDNLQHLHEALQQLYGAKQGQQIYNSFKPNTAYTDFLSKHQKLSIGDKQRQYCSIVFAVSAPGEVMPGDFPVYIIESWNKKKNLNSLRSLLQQRYGKEKSDKYYSLFKVHIKILTQLK